MDYENRKITRVYYPSWPDSQDRGGWTIRGLRKAIGRLFRLNANSLNFDQESGINGRGYADRIRPVGDRGWLTACAAYVRVIVIVPTCPPSHVFWINNVLSKRVFMVPISKEEIGVPSVSTSRPLIRLSWIKVSFPGVAGFLGL